MKSSIKVGQKVWLLISNPLEYGTPYLSIGVVTFINRVRGQLIYNCNEPATKRANILLNKDEIRPFTDQGQAEMLRELIHRLNLLAHHARDVSNSYFDQVGHYLRQLHGLEESQVKKKQPRKGEKA